jgi:cell division transport system ATP-binding protein
MAIFNSFHQVGVTLLISTHDEIVLQDAGVRVLALKHGELQASSTATSPEDSGEV